MSKLQMVLFPTVTEKWSEQDSAWDTYCTGGNGMLKI